MTTEEEIAALRRDALAADVQIWIHHLFSHFGSTWEQRRAFQADLRDAGFGAGGEVSADEEITGDGYWHHYAYTQIPASEAICREMDGAAARIAASHQARYDEWGVARDQEGRLQDLDGDFHPRPLG